MSSNEEDYSSEEDGDYVPEDTVASESEDEKEENVHNETNRGDELDTNKVDELWQSFKKDVHDSKTKEAKEATDKATSADISSTNDKDSSPQEVANEMSNAPTSTQPDSSQVEPATEKKKDTVTITKVYDFAGEEVKVTREFKKDSKEAQLHLKTQELAGNASALGRSGISGFKKRPSGGIGSVLGRLGKKPKLSTLEKSKLDWNQYKEEEGIQEELQNYNKGKEGYLEKVSFLERTEMRQFYKERDMRLNKSAARR